MLPSTSRPLYVRHGELHQVRGGRIVKSNCLLDVLDIIRQAGFWPLPPSLGAEGTWPWPLTADGLLVTSRKYRKPQFIITQSFALHGALGAHDNLNDDGRRGLLNMPQKNHWHGGPITEPRGFPPVAVSQSIPEA